MSIVLSVSALQAPQNNYGKLCAKGMPLKSFYGSNTPKKLPSSVSPLIKSNILASIKLSPQGNKALKDKYYAEVTKGVIPVEEGKSLFTILSLRFLLLEKAQLCVLFKRKMIILFRLNVMK